MFLYFWISYEGCVGVFVYLVVDGIRCGGLVESVVEMFLDFVSIFVVRCYYVFVLFWV